MKKFMFVIGLALILGGCQHVDQKTEENETHAQESPQTEKEHFRWSLIY